MAHKEPLYVGVDVGGTFTDIAMMSGDGTVFRQKAFTTPGDWAQGVLDGLAAAAKDHFGAPLGDLLSRVSEFTHGTTIVTNVIAQMNGRRVGLLTTRGFGDTLRIARSARQNTLDLQIQVAPPQLVAPGDIVEIEERIDSRGNVIVPLDDDQVLASLRGLIDGGVEALAVCFLSSFENPAHERQVRELLRRSHAQLPIFLSSDVHPVIREYERTVTTVLNAYVSHGVGQYLLDLQERLTAAGMRVPVGVMQCTGGITSIDDILDRPLLLLASGPVGGVIAARELAARLSIPKVICADMGGTSFDTALIEDGRVARTNRAEIERLKTGLTLVDVVSIGTGGGSIAHLDVAGKPQLGPRSAGAVPGPISYGRGGTRPTTTDIAVSLNLLSAEGFLAGRTGLDAEAARTTIERDLGGPLGMGLHDVCRGYYRIGVAAMAQAVRSVTVERGRNPRDFVLVSYGGASGLFIAEIARQIGISKIVIPEAASVFSAFGMLCGDVSRTNSRTINWKVASGELEILARTRQELDRLGRERLGEGAGIIEISWEADLKFGSQAFELTVRLEEFGEIEEATRAWLIQKFRAAYEARYGSGTHWEGAESLITLVNLRATISRKAARRPDPKGKDSKGTAAPPGRSSRRTIYWPEQAEVRVMATDEIEEQALSGPLVLEAGDTTIFVPTQWRASRDQWHNVHLAHDGTLQ